MAKSGSYHPCKICGKPVWRTPADIEKYNRHQTCSKKCMGVMFKGANNPFWGREHTEETRKLIKEKRALNPPKNPGPAKGSFRHTEEARKKMSDAVRQRWLDHRDKMLASLPRGLDHHFAKLPVDRRHRKHFSPVQRKEWTGTHCEYCGTTENLELDHIIPIFDGGTNDKCNAQTLCRHCNVWKTTFVDMPRYNAAKSIKVG